MNKLSVVAVIMIIIFLVVSFIPLSVSQSISVNKNSYYPREKVIVHLSEFGLGAHYTLCLPDFEIYHLEDDEWEKVIFSGWLFTKGSGYPDLVECINGTLRKRFYGICDVIIYDLRLFNAQSEYEWDMKVFEEEERVCGNETYTHYEEVNAPLGTYKAKYGMAEAVFSIR